jgi:hypothetical protein
MADQRYVYTTHETDTQRGQLGDLETVINEYAREGWRLVDTIDRDGTTTGLVFEREV